jgi:mono/diheme cytochrome c family protein
MSQHRISLATLSALLTLACGHSHVAPPATAPSHAEASAARGEYIVRNVAVCGQCHAADPHRDADGPLSGGMEFQDWRIGTARAANLTSDPETGLGNWSEAVIVRALRNGEDDEGKVLAPVMPYAWFHQMSDDDAFAVARYLKSLPPVKNEVTQSRNLMFKLGSHTFLKPLAGTTEAAPPRGVTAEYGGYLAQHVGLCGECHTPRTGVRSAPDRSRLFAGMTNPPKGFPAHPSNLTPDTETGIGSWKEEDFIRTLRTGTDPEGKPLNAFMPWRQVARMSDDDLRAIYLYLRTLPPIHSAIPRSK